MKLIVIDLDKVREIAKDLPGLDAALRSSMGMQIIKMSEPLKDHLKKAYNAGYSRAEATLTCDDGPRLPLTFEDFLKDKGYE